MKKVRKKADYIIEVTNLTKTFGNVLTADNIFLGEKGSFFAFLGKNGAGKTTTINILTVLVKPDEGINMIKKSFSANNVGLFTLDIPL